MKSKKHSSRPGADAHPHSHSPDGVPPCRVALLGCGAVCELYHAPALQHLEAAGTVSVTAVFDPDAARATKLCSLFPNAVAYPDESFLEKTPLDLALIASPVSFHEAHAIRALEAGIAVLCEKPLAANTESGERMIAAALKNRRILAVGLLRRFYSTVQFTRQIIQNKTLGAVTSFSIQKGGVFNWPARSDFFFRKNIAGGGVLIDLGVHVLDLVVHWFGEPRELTYSDDAMGGVEANCRLELFYSDGFKGTVQLSRDCNTPNCYVIEFERGSVKLRAGDAEQMDIRLNNSDFLLEGLLKKRFVPNSSVAPVVSASSFQQAFLVQLNDLIVAIRTGGQPSIPGEEAIRSLRLIEQCYQKKTLMDMPWLEPEEQKTSQRLAAGGAP